MKFAARSCLDVVFWLTDRALNDREYIQPAKLHRLLFLAQAYYSVAYPGRKLMPATFVVDAYGPIEPTIYHLFAYGRPHMVEGHPLPELAESFLDGIWRRFGQLNADQLTKKLLDHPPVAEAKSKGEGSEITLAAMVKFYGADKKAQAQGPTNLPTAPARPRYLRSAEGKPVVVTAWKPKTLDGK